MFQLLWKAAQYPAGNLRANNMSTNLSERMFTFVRLSNAGVFFLPDTGLLKRFYHCLLTSVP